MNLNHRIARLEEHTPTTGCAWCNGRMTWLVEDLPEDQREHPQPICPHCGARHEGVKFMGISRADWEAL